MPAGQNAQPLDMPNIQGAAGPLLQRAIHVFDSFKQSVTLNTIFRQAGQDPAQVVFREALLRL
jgi:hypothetical protein